MRLPRHTARWAIAFALAVSSAFACSRSADRHTDDSDLVALNNRGVGLMGQFDFVQARAVFERLAASHTDRADLQVNLAIATLNRQQEGDDAAAQEILRRVLAGDPQHLRAHYTLGLILLYDGHPDEALPHFSSVSDRRPDDAFAAYYVGQCRFQQSDSAGALVAYERALTLNPRLRSAAYGAFQARQRLGRADASTMLERFRALEIDPRSEVVEFKYTRMGPLGEAATIDRPVPKSAGRPAGPLFEMAPLKLAAGAPPVQWRSFLAAHAPSVTADLLERRDGRRFHVRADGLPRRRRSPEAAGRARCRRRRQRWRRRPRRSSLGAPETPKTASWLRVQNLGCPVGGKQLH